MTSAFHYSTQLYFEAGRDYTNNLHDELSHKIPSDLYKYKATLSFHTTKNMKIY